MKDRHTRIGTPDEHKLQMPDWENMPDLEEFSWVEPRNVPQVIDLDGPIHTTLHPYCDDATCPCHTDRYQS